VERFFKHGLSLTLGGDRESGMIWHKHLEHSQIKGKVPLQPIQIEDFQGRDAWEYDRMICVTRLLSWQNQDVHTGNIQRVLNREPACLVSHMLLDNNARVGAFGSNSKQHSKPSCQCKTGTTNDLRTTGPWIHSNTWLPYG
jgi:hypothetical protein